ncbi:kinetochore Sim4 complex subunit FTA2-domain-containing protein [Cladorrhinum sp. PSN332]|nr:kinetochore Sim4 complex subunit FTA2-domain-containing protein [Cladorrhinum sp. PSN332]
MTLRASPLPAIPGPKLAPFTPTASADIKFIKKLGHSIDKDGHVWKVDIKDRGPFALKIFPFLPWTSIQSGRAIKLARPLRSPQSYVDYFAPFNAECRVYGRLEQEDRQDLAVRAHGYLFLTSDQEADITQRILDHGWDDEWDDDDDAVETDGLGHKMWCRHESDRGQPIRAIVKELVEVVDENGGSSNVGFKPEQISQMWEDLERLHTFGILVRDIHYRNYLGGKLVDFGRAWTMFHPCFDQIDPELLRAERKQDMFDWERLIVDYWMEEGSEFGSIPWPEGYEKALTDFQRFGIDQRDYDWYKWEESREAAEAYVASNLYADESPPESDDERES